MAETITIDDLAPDVNPVPYTPRASAAAVRPFFLRHRMAEGIYV